MARLISLLPPAVVAVVCLSTIDAGWLRFVIRCVCPKSPISQKYMGCLSISFLIDAQRCSLVHCILPIVYAHLPCVFVSNYMLRWVAFALLTLGWRHVGGTRHAEWPIIHSIGILQSRLRSKGKTYSEAERWDGMDEKEKKRERGSVR